VPFFSDQNKKYKNKNVLRTPELLAEFMSHDWRLFVAEEHAMRRRKADSIHHSKLFV
jgi:hypothetical protein